MYQALYRKWRPRTFDDVVGQEHITETLKRQVTTGRLSHAYLFTGTRGTGKTTCAKILSRAVNCEHPVNGSPCNQCAACLGIENGSILDVLELDAASNNGVDQVRALRDEAVYTPAAVKKRVYIVDEVHMLSTAAFNALLKILEEPPEHLMFILATTELHKVPATIKSRCQQFSFKRILPTEISARLNYVCAQEGIALSTDAAALLARLADGGMRDALSLLDQCAGYSETVDVPQVLDALGLAGNVETARLMECIAKGDTAAALETLSRLYAAGKELRSLLGELSSLTRDLLIRKTAPQGGAALLTGGYDEGTMRALSELLPPARLLQMLTILQDTAADLGRSSNPRTDAELCLIRLCDPTLDGSVTGLTARLERLEQRIEYGVPAAPAVQAETANRGPQQTAPVQAAPVQAKTPPVSEPEDLPPWDLDPPPVREEPVKAPPPPRAAPQPTPRPAPQPAPAPRPAAAAPAASQAPAAPAGGDPAFWKALVPALMGKVPMGEYTFLSDPAATVGDYHDGVLTLWTDSDFVKGLLEKPAVLDPVTRECARMAGRSVQVFVKEGRPPVQAPAAPAAPAPTPSAPADHDNLDDLLALGRQFDNINIKE
ncbi:MAG: DNA polymerase III subunit gamma/tau [Oscillospiraceae bacterium]